MGIVINWLRSALEELYIKFTSSSLRHPFGDSSPSERLTAVKAGSHDGLRFPESASRRFSLPNWFPRLTTQITISSVFQILKSSSTIRQHSSCKSWGPAVPLGREKVLISIFSFFPDSLMGSASEDEDDDDNSTASSILKHHTIHGSLPPAPGETNNNSLPHSDISGSIGQVSSFWIPKIVTKFRIFQEKSKDPPAVSGPKRDTLYT